MVLIDDAGHLTATGGERELHAFAEGMGLLPVWYQGLGRFRHYDCTTPRARQRAREHGAVPAPFRVLVAVAHRVGLYDPELTSHVAILEERLTEYLQRPDARGLRAALARRERP